MPGSALSLNIDTVVRGGIVDFGGPPFPVALPSVVRGITPFDERKFS